MILKWASSFCGISRHMKLNSLQITKKFQTCAHHRAAQSSSNVILGYRDHHEFGKLKTIYHNPYIAHLKFAFTLRYTLLPAYVVLFFGELGAYWNEFFTLADVILLNFVKISIAAKVLLLRKLFINTIGFMYTTEDDSLVVSYVDSKGERMDEKFDKDQLKLTYTNEDKFYAKICNRTFVTLICQKSDRKFKLHLKYAEMFEEAVIDRFGVLPVTAF